MENQAVEDKRKKKKWLLLLLLLLVIVGGYFTYRILMVKPADTVGVVVGDFLPAGKDASKMSPAEVLKLAQATADKSGFNMRIVSEAHFNKETMNGALAIQNPPHNTQPINVIVTLDGEEPTIYESGAIQPGEEITNATLTKKLSPGSYPATAAFNIYDAETKKIKGKVNAGITLIVDD